MPVSVDAAFNELLPSLRATRTETAAARSHRISIEAKLITEFGLTAFFRSGSFGTGTSISGYSDVDYFAVIPRANLNADSGYALADIADALRDRFSTTPNIRVNGPAVRLPFGLDGAQATEIVPVEAVGFTMLGYRQFKMHDGQSGWMPSAPESHNAYVAEIDRHHNGGVKPLIRFLKAWRYARNVPIKSFYLEILAAEYACNQTAITYDIDLRDLFDNMLQRQLAPLLDPRFPNDGLYIQSTNTVLQTVEALDALQRAAIWASDAVALNHVERISAAFDRWRLVFNNDFPPYGP